MESLIKRRRGFSPRILFFTFFLFVVATPSYDASGAEYYSVVLQTTPLRNEAIATAKKASSQLGYHLALDTLKNPPPDLVINGLVVSLQQKNKNYIVTSYLGISKPEANQALIHAQKFFPKANLQAISVDESQLDTSYQQTFFRRVLILGSEKQYASALSKAKEISKKSKVPFSTRGMIYDSKKGLIWPDDIDDEIYRGTYYGRRYQECDQNTPECITIERSEFYGFTPGLYIIVGGIYEEGDPQIKEKLNQFQKIIPDAYAKSTPIYTGCVH